MKFPMSRCRKFHDKPIHSHVSGFTQHQVGIYLEMKPLQKDCPVTQMPVTDSPDQKMLGCVRQEQQAGTVNIRCGKFGVVPINSSWPATCTGLERYRNQLRMHFDVDTLIIETVVLGKMLSFAIPLMDQPKSLLVFFGDKKINVSGLPGSGSGIAGGHSQSLHQEGMNTGFRKTALQFLPDLQHLVALGLDVQTLSHPRQQNGLGRPEARRKFAYRLETDTDNGLFTGCPENLVPVLWSQACKQLGIGLFVLHTTT